LYRVVFGKENGEEMIYENCSAEMEEKKVDVQLDIGECYAVFRDISAYICPECGAQDITDAEIRLDEAEIVPKEGTNDR